MLKTKCTRTLSKNDILSIVVLSLVIGSFALAWVDKDIRVTFADLAKVGVGGYIAPNVNWGGVLGLYVLRHSLIAPFFLLTYTIHSQFPSKT